jgi:NADPH:quinone reductase-like Zn-dependent oxidoreductase
MESSRPASTGGESTPATMRVLRLGGSSRIPVLTLQETARPEPRGGEVLLRVQAVGVTPTELRWYPTTHNKDGSPRPHVVPDHRILRRNR